MDASKAAIAERIATLPGDKREKFFAELKRKGIKFDRLPIVARQKTKAALCSVAQSRLWFLWQLDKDSTAYHIAAGLRLQGQLSTRALRSAFETLVSRHESLRTVFRASDDGTAEQVVQPSHRFELLEYDVSAWSHDVGELQAAETAQRIAHTPFDLTTGPLFRVGLIRLSATEHVLVVVMHHIVSDGWSMRIIVEEFVELYLACLEGRVATLKPLAIQYADYATWQRHWLEAGEQERQLAYWRGRYSADYQSLQLPMDHPRPTEPRYRGGRYSVDLPASVAEGLHRRALEHQATLFMLLLAGLQALLHRYTGQSAIRVGTTNANRNRPETQGIVGFFVNTQVLQGLVESEMTLSALLQQVREEVLGAQDHQDLPFEQLVGALQPRRDRISEPPFQVLLDHQRKNHELLRQLPGLTLQSYGLGEQGALFDLWINTVEHGDGRVSASISYARELFEPETIERLGAHYVKVLRAIADRPEQSLHRVELLGEDERQQLQCWGAGSQPHAFNAPVHRLIERQVRQHPNATALFLGEAQISYAELNSRSNRLAHRLMTMGVRVEDRVGVAFERSIEMVVALLAVMKAGAAYVPLDPELPAERLNYMARDSGIELVLTQGYLRERLPDGATMLALDEVDISAECDSNPALVLHPEHLAYVIYTSGSTGRPKGAANRHAALSNRLAWMQEAYELGAHETVLQKTPLGFDVSVWEFFWPLMQGAGLALAPPGAHRDPGQLIELIRRHEVSTLHFVPSMLQAFLEHEAVGSCSSLRRIVCSGEALSLEAQAKVLARLPGAKLYNLYGPTEAAIDVTHWTCAVGKRRSVPIGRPIAGTLAMVLDGELNLVPLGVAGELYLGGVGLARGYLHKPGLTAERFVADPDSHTGQRLYRTGDLVRWSADGQLEYLGRIDHQVKIRGLRIELGEIESQLLAQPEIRAALVIARDQKLVAYVVPADPVLDTAILRERLSLLLPDYMVPSAFVSMTHLPVNVNGKLDRAALPPPVYAAAREYEAPQGAAEETLAAIWSEVLGVEQVGRHDSFFELGGDSLQMMKVLPRLRERSDLLSDLTLTDLMREPILARLVRRRTYRSASNPLVRLNEAGRPSVLFCIHQVAGAVFSYFPLAQSLRGSQTVYGLMCRSLIQAEHRDVSIQQMAHDYACMIDERQPGGPCLLFGHSLGGLLAAWVAHFLQGRGRTVAFLGLVDPFVPLTEVSDNEDTRADLLGYLRSLLPHARLADGWMQEAMFGDADSDESNERVNQAVRELLHEQPNLAQDLYLEMSAEEIAASFLVRQRLTRLARQSPTLPRLQIKPHCWWSLDRAAKDRIALQEQMGETLDREDIDAGHEKLIRDPRLVKDVVRVLNGPPT
ncbi:MAG: amino acid adenylation domain-containing protein [Steroidobacteraceae bacterium]